MKVALAQINPTVGDLDGNIRKILRFAKRAERGGADFCLFPEMAITGYPARDLLLDNGFIEDNLKGLKSLAGRVGKMTVMVGFADRNRSSTGKGLFNAAALVRNGKILRVYHKRLLPAYDVFDEDRYFDGGDGALLADIAGKKAALSICEDVWNIPGLWKRRFYAVDPVEEAAKRGAELLVNISASPFVIGRNKLRRRILKDIASKYGIPVFYVNQVGGNDQLIFDGCSVVFDAGGNVIARGKAFEEDLIFAESHSRQRPLACAEEPVDESVYGALALGVRDYAGKCGFKGAVIGLSGGIDSSVTACLAVEALGRKNVHGVAMPSVYTSRESIRDARELAGNLGISFELIPIKELQKSYTRALKPHFRGRKEDATEENIQARIRGNILMALSNKFGWLVLSTGNKSELAVGYCTLYGDMTGGLAVISDAPKTLVYRLAHYINRNGELIPSGCITKAPSAELRSNQKDEDSLPPYDVLDAVLARYLEKKEKPDRIIAAGYPAGLVREIIRRVERNEYKREQAPPGLKISSKAFGMGRRMPIAQKYY